MADSRLFGKPKPYREAMNRGDWDHAIALLESQAAELEGASLPSEEQLTLATLRGLRGDVVEALRLLNDIRQSSDPELGVRAAVQSVLLRVSSGIDNHGGVEQLLADATELAGDNQHLLGLIAHAKSRVLWRQAQFEAAGDCLEEAQRMLEESGDEDGLAKVLDSLALYHEYRGNQQRALSCYSLSLCKKAQWRDLYGVAVTLGNLGRLHLRMNDPETALSCLKDDLKIAVRLGDLRAQTVVKINIGQALTDLLRAQEAKAELTEALEQARRHQWVEQEVYALKDLARATALDGDTDHALDLLSEAIALLPEGRGLYPRGQVLLALGEVHLQRGALEEAHEAYDEAHRVFGSLKARHDEALAYQGLARVAQRRGDIGSSRRYSEAGIGCAPFPGSTTAVLFQDLFAEIEHNAEQRPVPASVGPYRIVSRLDGGAYADVYRAVDETGAAGGRDVAVKCLRFDEFEKREELDDRLTRFDRECQVLTGIRHPNVVRILAFGVDPCPYLVMEFLPGGDLRKLTRSGDFIPVERALCLGRGVLNGLAALHDRQVVHRDLKPANVLLRSPMEPVIVDFGMVRMLAQTAITLRSTVLGTVAYMPPEQLQGPNVDARADLYAFGGILFQLLAGRPPLLADSLPEMVGKIKEESPPDVRTLRPGIPPRLAECITRCLEKDPDQRYPAARAVLAALDAVS